MQLRKAFARSEVNARSRDLVDGTRDASVVIMRLTPILGLILVAATSTATAEHEELGGRVSFNTTDSYRPPVTNRDWVRLASQTPTKYGTEYFIVGRDAGWFRTLRIDAISGTVGVRRIQIVSPGRLSKTFYVERWLDARHPVAFVDLGVPRRIEQLVVTTDRFPAGVYTIFGSSGAIPNSRNIAER